MSEEPILYESRLGNIQQKDIEFALQDAGIQKGDILLVHSDIASIGKLGKVKNRNDFLNCILQAFLNVLGGGTLLVPTYTYSYCKSEVYDVVNTKSTVGTFSEFVRKNPEAIRSEDPIFSHAGIGPDAEILLLNTSKDCFGEGSFCERLIEADAKIMNFGCNFEITFMHYIEWKKSVDYRFNKSFNGESILKNGSKIQDSYNFYVRALPENGMQVEYEMPKLGARMAQIGKLRVIPLGNHFVLCATAKDCFEVGMDLLNIDPYAFLKGDPRKDKIENEG